MTPPVEDNPPAGDASSEGRNSRQLSGKSALNFRTCPIRVTLFLRISAEVPPDQMSHRPVSATEWLVSTPASPRRIRDHQRRQFFIGDFESGFEGGVSWPISC
jgi:hypothetical protein